MRSPDTLPPIAIGLKRTANNLSMGLREMACATGMSLGSMSAYLNSGNLPKRHKREQVEQALRQLCDARGATVRQMAGLFRPTIIFNNRVSQSETARAKAPAVSILHSHYHVKKEDDDMLLPKQTMTQAARAAFGFFTNPFDGEVSSAEQMFQNTEFRFCREACWQAATNSRFVAIVGESGSGKTTLLGDTEDRILTDHKQIIVIKPSVLGMESNDKAGKTLKASGIMDAIIYTLDPACIPRQTMEAKTRQLQRMLEDSAKSGNSHLLVIEEAHALPVVTLKHLKRLHELRMGRKPLLGILLLGQTELRDKLNPARHDVREVAQRCEVVGLEPLDGDLQAYLQTRFSRDGKKFDEVMDKDAVDAVRARLTHQGSDTRGSKTGPTSMVYPLAVNNFMTAALNQAAALGSKRLTRDLVMEV
jgi:type II secretory pathway predicted ATPase ExeA/transcriptional regulator with XRE-family HTH domain